MAPVAIPAPEPVEPRRYEAAPVTPPIRFRPLQPPAPPQPAPEVSVRALPRPTARPPAPSEPKPQPAAVETLPPAQYAPPVQVAPLPPQVPSTGTSSHRVVVDANYSSQVQQIRQDAYVRPDDGKVQVGAYQDVSAAQQQAEELRRQGIPARVE
ncbi:MAG: hypothetical protein HC919_10600 [Oscillatoriales cyanobacterium SM2_2_1]|nr:hypothetical protein [Oscillatoriales cyanobacterium SM2_2_1]